jgi:aldehyde dehydrogenase (NAD+)
MTNSDYQKVFEAQKRCAQKLRSEPYKARIGRLKAIERWIFSNRSKIQEAVFADFQKSAAEADLSEIYPVVSEIRKMKRSLRHWVRPQKVSNNLPYWGTKSEIQYEPKGVTLIIAPWNYPFLLAVGPLLSAISAGNTVFLKPSEFTSHTSQLIEDMIKELFAEDMIYVVQGDFKVSGQLLELPFDHIFFTGSPRVGKIVMQAAAQNLTSVTLELGGKSPAIVDESADIDDAAQKIAWGKWLNAGQTCVAPDYILVHESKRDELVGKLIEYVGDLYGDIAKYTGIINQQHLERLTAAIEASVVAGSTVVHGGMVVAEGKLSPTILIDVPDSSSLLQDEIFGPVLPIRTFVDMQDAVDYVNDKPKPLALYYFSRKEKSINNVKKAVSAGTMCINDCVVQFVHPELPIGGVNNSGIGKGHGYFGFLAFSNEKAVVKQRVGMTMSKTLYPPLNPFKKLTLELLLKYF